MKVYSVDCNGKFGLFGSEIACLKILERRYFFRSNVFGFFVGFVFVGWSLFSSSFDHASFSSFIDLICFVIVLDW